MPTFSNNGSEPFTIYDGDRIKTVEPGETWATANKISFYPRAASFNPKRNRIDLDGWEKDIMPTDEQLRQLRVNMQAAAVMTRRAGLPPLTIQWSAPNPASFAPENPVTPEMIAAADAIGFCMSEESYAALYRAMAALAPVELVSEGERQAMRERDEARDELEDACERLSRAPEGGVSVVYHLAQKDALSDTIDCLRAQLAARDTRIAELDSRLAVFTANVPDPPSEPAHNPFRIPPRDPRRMGP